MQMPMLASMLIRDNVCVVARAPSRHRVNPSAGALSHHCADACHHRLAFAIADALHLKQCRALDRTQVYDMCVWYLVYVCDMCVICVWCMWIYWVGCSFIALGVFTRIFNGP